MSTENKDRITCHVLDTSAGIPAKGLRITLSGPVAPPFPPPPSSSSSSAVAVNAPPLTATGNPPPPPVTHTFESTTDSDGRVKVWLPYSSATSSGDIPVYTLEDVLGQASSSPSPDGSHEGAEGGPSTPQTWTLRFDTAGYFGGVEKTFFPEVSVTFTVMPRQRYHVPLLLSPYSYTTYRGS
ncbi:hydroxyisourate hydrolase [Zalerion maritima]|uniref:Hydroxyisourate hydrolase n=1 Tax=Zalerion maritima TaxID=339359 RepID=A0AAD5WRD7_9PEZI|nr:hydroxyisourate hydrolase [Zalerion maritima]